jgi:NADH dehydrogenase FAD-containing subunit
MELLPPPTGREAIPVYAIGDVATIKLPNGKALPKSGVFATARR